MVIALFAVLIAAAPSSEGRDEFELGKRYFVQRRYVDALPWLERAYELSKHRPSTILGLAQCERALGRVESAIAHYREYLASQPPPSEDEAAAVRLAIEALEAERASNAATATATIAALAKSPEPAREEPIVIIPPAVVVAPSPPVAATEPPTPIYAEPLFWLAAALVAIGTGTVFAMSAGSADPEPWGGTIGHELHR